MASQGFGSALGMASIAAQQGLSANAAYRLAQQAGLGIRRQVFLQGYKELLEATGARNKLLGLPLAGRPTAEQISRFTSQGATGYSHIVSIYTLNKATGEVGTQHISVKSSTLLTKQEAEEAAFAAYTEGEYNEEEQAVGVSLIEVKQYTPDSGT